MSAVSPPIWPGFDGPRWRHAAIEVLRSGLPRNPPPVWIVLLVSRSNRKYEVARISAQEKLRAFREAGVPAQLVTRRNWRQFADSMESLLLSETFKIVQHPLPKIFASLPVANDLDLDPTRGWVCPQYAKPPRER